MSLPDFVIIGAMKCATSTLATQLALQEGIFLTDPKEPNFFSDDAVHARGLDWYARLFDPARPGDLKGEASTHYTKQATHPHAPARMADVLAAPRLIYLIRHPVERIVSHFIHEWTMGRMRGSPDAAVAAHPELVDYSCYGHQIAPYVSHFGADRILVVTLEAMQADPQQVLEEVCAFIGHRSRPVWQAAHARENASAERLRRLPMHEVVFANPVATALRRRLVPQAVRDRLKRARQIPERPALSAPLVRDLESRFAEDYAHLAALLPGRAGLARSYPFLAHDVRDGRRDA